jgi:hypothetical protein
MGIPILLFLAFLISPSDSEELKLTRDSASRFAHLVLNCVTKQFPNKPDHVMTDRSDVRPPKVQHPAFYGSYDWHSCVHGHGLLVHLLRQFPDPPEAKTMRMVLDENLTPEKIKDEIAYLDGSERKSFERTYGWAWLLKLEAELHSFKDPDAARWFTPMWLSACPLDWIMRRRQMMRSWQRSYSGAVMITS